MTPALPPWSLTTLLINVIVGAISSFVIVQVMFSPSSSVTFPPRTVGHFASPVIDVKVYPASNVSLIANGLFESKEVTFPDCTNVPLTVNIKSSGTAFPPLSLITCLINVRFEPSSSLVIVQVANSFGDKEIVEVLF